MGWGPSGGGASGAQDWAKRLREQDPTFTALYIMRFRRFNDEDAHIVFQALQGNHTLLELSTGHPCSLHQAADLSQALSVNTTLRSLKIGDRAFDDGSLERLIPGIAASRSLTELEMSGAPLSPGVAERLGSALLKGNLSRLDLSGKPIEEGSFASLAAGLTNLSHLDISNCNLGGTSSANPSAASGDSASGSVGQAMQRVFSAAKLKSLVISGNALDAAFCHQTAHGLAAATQLTSLNLSDNSIGPKGCIALVSELPNAAISPVPPEAACQLRALDLSGCGIGDAGFVALCTAIARGVQLRRLQVGRAGLSAAGVAEGVQQLRSMKDCSIETLDVSGSHDCIDASSVACLGSLASLRKLSLFDCAMGNSNNGAEALLQLLKGSLHGVDSTPFGNLTDLDLCGNELDVQQLQQLLDVLLQGCLPSLKILVLGANPGTDNSEAFAEAAQPLMDARPQLDLIWRPPT